MRATAQQRYLQRKVEKLNQARCGRRLHRNVASMPKSDRQSITYLRAELTTCVADTTTLFS